MTDRYFIGSSDISTILNLNPFSTVLELWAEKTGQIPPRDLSDNEAVEWGTRLERVVSKKFSEKHEVKLIAYKKRFHHPKYDFLSCELDNLIAGTDEIVEIKTTNAWKFKAWEDDIPPYITCQVMWALGITGRKIGHIAVLVGGQKYLEKRVEFDAQIFNAMVKKAVIFWNEFILTKKMPATITSKDGDTLFQLYSGEDIQLPVELTDREEAIIESIDSLTADKYAIEAEIEQQKNELKTKLGDSVTGFTNNHRVSWKRQETKRVDSKKLKSEYPDIYENCINIIPSRVLRIYDKKGE